MRKRSSLRRRSIRSQLMRPTGKSRLQRQLSQGTRRWKLDRLHSARPNPLLSRDRNATTTTVSPCLTLWLDCGGWTDCRTGLLYARRGVPVRTLRRRYHSRSGNDVPPGVPVHDAASDPRARAGSRSRWGDGWPRSVPYADDQSYGLAVPHVRPARPSPSRLRMGERRTDRLRTEAQRHSSSPMYR